MIRKLLIGVAAFVAIAMLVLSALIFMVHRNGARALETATQRWEPLGGLPDFAAMRPQPISDDRNAAVEYALIFDLVSAINEVHRTDDVEQPYAQQVCDDPRLAEVISRSEAAAAQPECVWESRWFDEGFEALLPHMGSARNLAALLAKAARCRAEQGDHEHATRSIAAGLALASNVTASEPSIIAALVSASIYMITLEVLKESFNDVPIPPGVDLASALNATEYRAMLRRCLVGETAVGVDAFERFGADEVPAIAAIAGWTYRADLAHYLNLMRHGIEQLDAPPAQRDWTPFEQEPSIRTMLSHLIAPAIHRGVLNALAAETEIHLAREAIKLRDHRAQHGEYPEHWAMPDDPVTGSPLRYERNTDGFILWSDAEPRRNQERIEWRWR